MRRLALLLAAATMPTAPALAQHQGHQGHAMPMPAPKKPAAKPAPKKAPVKPAAKKPQAKAPATKKPGAKPAAKKPAATPASKAAPAKKPTVDPHAGHQMPAEPAADVHSGHQTEAADPHAGHQPDVQPDPHAGHQTSDAAADPHAGHNMAADVPAPPTASPPPAAFSGPPHAADAVFGAQRMAAAREELRTEHGDMRVGKLLVDRLEVRLRDGSDGYAWDADAWYGGDIDKLWMKTEGEGEFGRAVEAAEVQALWSHAIGPFFDLQAGLRYDIRPRPDRGHLVLGVQGLAPYWFEVDAAAFLSDKGDLTARVEAEYDQRITQKLILQPRVEFDLAAQDVPELGIAAGLSAGALGLRLRYEIEPRFAPYLGVEYERAFGDTADFRRAAGEDAGGWSLLLGLRAWF